jgi:hypothetical protein
MPPAHQVKFLKCYRPDVSYQTREWFRVIGNIVLRLCFLVFRLFSESLKTKMFLYTHFPEETSEAEVDLGTAS